MDKYSSAGYLMALLSAITLVVVIIVFVDPPHKADTAKPKGILVINNIFSLLILSRKHSGTERKDINPYEEGHHGVDQIDSPCTKKSRDAKYLTQKRD